MTYNCPAQHHFASPLCSATRTTTTTGSSMVRITTTDKPAQVVIPSNQFNINSFSLLFYYSFLFLVIWLISKQRTSVLSQLSMYYIQRITNSVWLPSPKRLDSAPQGFPNCTHHTLTYRWFVTAPRCCYSMSQHQHPRCVIMFYWQLYTCHYVSTWTPTFIDGMVHFCVSLVCFSVILCHQISRRIVDVVVLYLVTLSPVNSPWQRHKQ